LVTGKKLVNKLINSSRFVFMNLDGKPKKPNKLKKIDELFLNRMKMVVNSSTAHFEKYEYSRAKIEIENFFWEVFCNDYLEIVKKRVYQGEGDEKLSAQYTLYHSLLTVLKMFAPIVPFVTEHLYQEHFRKNENVKSIHQMEWPTDSEVSSSGAATWTLFKVITSIISKVRKEKTSAQKSMNAEIVLTITKEDKLKIKELLEDLKNVTNAREVKEGKFKVEFVE